VRKTWALLLLLIASCAARSEISSPDADISPCGAGFACLAPGSYYDCMPPQTPALVKVCEGTCHEWIIASCPGVGFAY
jgi:hypothetical protein